MSFSTVSVVQMLKFIIVTDKEVLFPQTFRFRSWRHLSEHESVGGARLF